LPEYDLQVKAEREIIKSKKFLGCTRSYTYRLPAKPVKERAGPATGAKRSLSAMGNYTLSDIQIKYDRPASWYNPFWNMKGEN